MSNERDTSRTPTPDPAEHNAFFPSPYSLSQYTSAKTDFDGADYPTPYKGGKKVLMIGTDERYILMQNASMFSTGNHPVEMLLPMYHLDKAGFEFDVATLSGNPVKLEMWAMPGEDEAVKSIYAKYLPKLKAPRKLADLLEQAVADDSPYAAVFVPGGHGVLAGIPHSREVKRLLNAFLARTATSSPFATVRPACWHRRSRRSRRTTRSRATRSACSPTPWTPAPTWRSATCPVPCPGWWARTCRSSG